MLADRPVLISLARATELLRIPGPRGIRSLISILSSSDDYIEFRRIIKLFVADKENEILMQRSPFEQITVFCQFFEDKYFPLWPMLGAAELFDFEEDGEGPMGYWDLNNRIPFNPFGLEEDDILAPEDKRLGVRLMLLFLEAPARTILLESLKEDGIQESILTSVVPKTRDELHEILDGTQFEVVAQMADWWEHETDNIFLDYDDENACMVSVGWTVHNVTQLTEEWNQSEALTGRIMELADKLENDKHSSLLTQLINTVYPDLFVVPKEQMPLFTGGD